jgi:hypothetical protein
MNAIETSKNGRVFQGTCFAIGRRVTAGLAALAALAAGAAGAAAQAQVDWVVGTRGVMVAVDAADNVFTADFDQNLGTEIVVTKRDVDGNLLWVSEIDQTDNSKWERAQWVAVDSQGAVLVCGTLMSGFSNPVEAASLLLKFAPDGTPVYRIVYESGFDGSSTRKLLLDQADNAYVLGKGPAVTKIKKFTSNGVSQWTWLDPYGIGLPVNFKFAPNGDMVVTGRAVFGSINGYARVNRQGNSVWGLPGVQSLTVGDAAGDGLGNSYLVHGEFVSNGGTVIKKLDPQGALLWERAYPSSGFRIEVGSDQAAVVSGFPNSGAPGAAFFKVDPAGSLLWSNLDADGPLALLLHAHMLLDASNNAYLAASTLFDMAVCKVRADGTSAWTVTTTGSNSSGIALGNQVGSVFVTGGNTARLVENVPEIGTSYCVGAPNSVGPGASITVYGSTVVADNDVLLTAQGLPPNLPGIFIFAPLQVQVPFGAGFRCVGGSITRVLPLKVATPWGTIQRALDLQVPPASGLIVPGSTHNFQFWYRDPLGPGGSTFNLSNGRQVVFQ